MSLNNNTDRICNNYNRQIKKLLMIVCSSVKRNAELEDIRDRVKIAIDVDPNIIIETTGEYIMEYKHYIENDSFEELLDDNVFNLEKYNVDNKFILKLFKILKIQYINYTQEEKKVVHDIIKNLLKFNLEYISKK